MTENSKIEWTDATWNPVVGCSIVSPACKYCYAMRIAFRMEAISLAHEAAHGGDPGPLEHYRRTTKNSRAGPVWTGTVRVAPETILTLPLRWKKPKRIFVNSMSDLFHEGLQDEAIAQVFGVMAVAGAVEYPEDAGKPCFGKRWTGKTWVGGGGPHTFQVLTKRPQRMRDLLRSARFRKLVCQAAYKWAHNQRNAGYLADCLDFEDMDYAPGRSNRLWPLPNVWLGVSVEDQARADERIPLLLDTPAAVRFVSAEPLLGPIDLRPWIGCSDLETRTKLSWVIVGGESGPGARPMHPDWARSLRDQCAAAGVPFFFKQWGEWLDERVATAMRLAPGPEMFDRHGQPRGPGWHFYDAVDRNGGAMIRVGKKAAGRLLDGRMHDEFPGVMP